MATQAEITRFLEAILGFESGGDATAQNAQASASGLFGYIDSTWDNFGGYAHAREAPAEVQWQKARLDVASKLAAYGGDWRKVAMAWYYPAWVNDPSKYNSIPRPDAGNTATLAQYADLVMSRFTGSRVSTASASTSGGGTVAESTAPKSRQQLLDYIAENYPEWWGVLNLNPEVKEVLLTAAEKEYSDAKLRAELSQTAWWRKNAETARKWDAGYAADKTTGDALLQQTGTSIAAQAARFGVTLSAADIRKLALNVHRNGWSEQQVTEALAHRFRIRTASPGQGTATVDSLRALAADYGVQLSDHTLSVNTQRILAGTQTPEGFRSYVIKQAQSLYPSIASDISEGQTVRDYFDPYVQIASRTLGVNPEDVDLSDTKWRRLLTMIDPDTGKRRAMSLDEAEREMRTNRLYGYDLSVNGQREAGEFVNAMAGELGLR